LRVFITLDIKKLLKPVLLVAACFIMLWLSSNILRSTSTIIQKDKGYLILAYNDIGMHCIQSDYSLETMTIHKLLGDTIITEGLKYTTRPFIWLFWLGGFMILTGILGVLLFSKIASIES
jgi:hypothetical protein